MSSGNLRELPLFADIVDHDRKGLSYHVIGKADGTSISDHTYQMTSDDNTFSTSLVLFSIMVSLESRLSSNIAPVFQYKQYPP